MLSTDLMHSHLPTSRAPTPLWRRLLAWGLAPSLLALIFVCVWWASPEKTAPPPPQVNTGAQVSAAWLADTATREAAAQRDAARAKEQEEEDLYFTVRALAKKLVTAQLLTPSQARFPGFPTARISQDRRMIVITGQVDSQNAFGAMLRQTYTVQLTRQCAENLPATTPGCFVPVTMHLGDQSWQWKSE